MTSIVATAALVGVIGFLLGFVVGGKSEALYWADHADEGDICYRGTFNRITKKIGQRK